MYWRHNAIFALRPDLKLGVHPVMIAHVVAAISVVSQSS
jgi:hypothetical protein